MDIGSGTDGHPALWVSTNHSSAHGVSTNHSPAHGVLAQVVFTANSQLWVVEVTRLISVARCLDVVCRRLEC